MVRLLALTFVLGACVGRSTTPSLKQPQDDAKGYFDRGSLTSPESVGEQDQTKANEQAPQGQSGPETCDGWDNDANGHVDDGLGGETCDLGNGLGSGTTFCRGGVLHCWACEPGSTKNEQCGCGTVRVDVCGDDGRFRAGACDSCEKKEERCGECVPGEEAMRRCDACTGGDCGTECIGALWRCGQDCKWAQVSDCKAMNPACNADQVVNESCGNCGSQRVVCDGCFWIKEACKDEGICHPGDKRTVPCFADECSNGMVSEIECSDSCEWNPPTACTGCNIGDVTSNVTQACVPGHSCGTKQVRQECQALPPVEICGGEAQLQVGHLVTIETGSCTIACQPGQTATQGCTAAGGVQGSQTATCADNCTMGAFGGCTACPNACTPSSTQQSCGANMCGAMMTVNHVCSTTGCGGSDVADRSTCPACAANTTSSRSCTTADNRCGTQSRTCSGSCSWGAFTTCQPVANACVNGTVQRRPCQGQCGSTGFEEWTCQGCNGFVQTKACDAAPPCTPGDHQILGECVQGQPLCGNRERTCDASCSWVETGCPPCG